MFPLRFIDRAKFFMERQFVRGALFQLLIVIGFIGLISLIGGLLVHPSNEPTTTFTEAVWWAFLRLTDPGYLGDDEGTWRRIVSTILTVSGYVVFLGALVAIMTQRLIVFMRDLEQGLTPVTLRDHVVVLGWTNRTVPLVAELMVANHSRRRALLRHSDRLRLVVLAEEISAARANELHSEPGMARQMKNVILRSGTAIQPDALHRAACLAAATVIIPGGSHGPHSLVSPDTETIKALLSLDAQVRNAGTTPPKVVAELQDVRKLPILRSAYSGQLEVVAGDVTISRLMAQNILHPGLSEVYRELMSASKGSEFYLREAEEGDGRSLGNLAAQLPRAIVCGLLRKLEGSWQPYLNVPSDTVIEPGDLLVFVAPTADQTYPEAHRPRTPDKVERNKSTLPVEADISGRRVLVLGWNHRLPAMIQQLATYAPRGLTLDLVSTVPATERERAIARYGATLERVSCRQLEADYMEDGELREIAPASYDTVLVVSSDRLHSGEEADARAMVGYMILEETLRGADKRPQILLELSDPGNESLIVGNRAETIISPLILSHLLGQVAVRPELRVVLDELFTAGGAEIVFREAHEYQLPAAQVFWKLEASVAKCGETALGIYRAKAPAGQGRLLLNPEHDQHIELQPGDQIVALTTARPV